jgi:mono/diheme cytochrome c family protein
MATAHSRTVRRSSTVLSLAVFAAATLGLTACQHEQPNTIYMPDMVYSPGLKAQAEGAMRMPVAGTVPRNFEPYHFTNIDVAGRELKNPLQATAAVLKRGQAMYNTYCIVCHGPNGEGDGSVVAKGFPRPPSLQADKIRTYPDGSIYHIMSMGQNNMPSYASQVSPGDRWATITYIRALQRAKHPSAEDIKAAESE